MSHTTDEFLSGDDAREALRSMSKDDMEEHIRKIHSPKRTAMYLEAFSKIFELLEYEMDTFSLDNEAKKRLFVSAIAEAIMHGGNWMVDSSVSASYVMENMKRKWREEQAKDREMLDLEDDDE